MQNSDNIAVVFLTSLASVLGVGGLAKIITQYVKNRGDEDRRKDKLLEKVVEREATGAHKIMNSWQACEERLSEVRQENADLRAQVEGLKKENKFLRAKVATLEANAVKDRDRIERMETDISELIKTVRGRV